MSDNCERVVRDCDANGEDDFCDILFNNANDFNANGIPDSCDANGLNVVMDFEDTGVADQDYAIGPVHDQPVNADDFPIANPAAIANADWGTIDFNAGAFTGAAGLADVTAGAIGSCGGGKTLVVFEDGTASLGYRSPAIPSTDPNFDTAVVFVPTVHSISFDIVFSHSNYQVDWGFSFDNVYDTVSNAWRAFLRFETRADGAREIVLFHGAGVEYTGVDWFTGAGVAHTVELRIDFAATNFDLANAGTLYWDGVQIATFSPRDQDLGASGAFPLMHRITLQNDANTSGLGAPADGTITLDCIIYKSSEERVTCSQYKLPDGSVGSDCDLDGICDHFQIASSPNQDLNANGILDHCEGWCIDCNHNGIPDSSEIANSSGLDMDLNGVLDVCDRTTHSNDFEADEYGVGDGFALGQIDGQQGWQNFLDAEGVITDAATAPAFATGSQYLVVRDNLDALGSDGIIAGPRLDGAGDADMELWSWDWRTTATGGDIGLVQVEILDVCLDGPALVGGTGFIFVDPWLETGNGNVGLRMRPDASDNGTIDVEMLGISSGARQYSSAPGTAAAGSAHSGVNIEAGYQSAAGLSAGIMILNQTGRVRGYSTTEQGNMESLLPGFASVISTEGTHAETQTITSIWQPGSNNRSSGGDQQILIRITSDDVIGQFGADNDNEYWFDNFNYQVFDDCDFDGINDALWVVALAGIPNSGPENDRNADGIPDRCQDCDDDCVWVMVPSVIPGWAPHAQLAAGNTSCLDPCEIDAAAPGCVGGGSTESDCNSNGTPDSCDTAFGLTANADASDGYLHIGYYDAGVTCTFYSAPAATNDVLCQFTRDGGGSGDADANGTPDECQITGGAADCNENGLVDAGEIAAGTAVDANANTIPDECENDCNNNGRLDDADLQSAGGNSADLFPIDGIPDECCPAGQLGGDLDGDGDSDSDDYGIMQMCGGVVPGTAGLPGPIGAGIGVVAGQETGAPPDQRACGCGDLNGDGIINECDMQIFQLVITGP